MCYARTMAGHLSQLTGLWVHVYHFQQCWKCMYIGGDKDIWRKKAIKLQKQVLSQCTLGEQKNDGDNEPGIIC
jgi:hypothetical protein